MTATTARRRSGGVPRRSRQTVESRESALQRELTVERNNLELLESRLREAVGSVDTSESGVVDLERRITQDPGWRLFSVLQAQEFSPEGMTQLRAVCRLMSLSNPLMKRGLELRRVYVHGQGCEIRARATGRTRKDQGEEQDVNAVIDKFIRNRTNQKTVFGQQAAGELEAALGTDGEVFIALFTKPLTGWVSARTFAADEITEIITNPDDRSEPWYYRRVWQRQSYDKAGHLQYVQQELLYPDIDYRPKFRPGMFAGVKVEWAAPVIQVAVNRPLNWLRGIPDAYAAINWTRAYKEFLEQWARLMKSLAAFAWKLTTEGKNRTQAKAALQQAGTSRAVAGDTNEVGGTALLPLNAQLEAIPKSGATIDAMSGRPLAMMAAAGLGVPVTMLLNDPGQTGARATAETLDWPTELTFTDRREVWSAVRLRVCHYVITEAVRASSGPLKGKIVRDSATNEEVVELAGDTDDTVDIVWPDLDDVEAKEIIDGIVLANSTGTLPPEFVLRQLLTAMGVRDVDSILTELEDEQGNFQWPTTAATAQQSQQAAPVAAAGGAPVIGGDPAAAAGPGGPGVDGDAENMPPGSPGGPGAQPGPGGPAVPGQVGTAIIPADGPLAMQNDADFGLFGGSDAPAPAEGTEAPGEQPDVDTFDPDFYTIGAGQPDTAEDTVPDEPTTPAPRRRAPTTREAEQLLTEAAAAQGDADFGLGGSTTPAQRAAADRTAGTAPAGAKPTSTFDPAFFTL
jgi:hypothetical protein